MSDTISMIKAIVSKSFEVANTYETHKIPNDVIKNCMGIREEEYDMLVDKWMSSVKYLSTQSSAKWSKLFDDVIHSSHSMRIEKIDGEAKEKMRKYTQTCMACGKHEKHCTFAIDFVGSLPRDAFSKAERLVKDFKTFLTQYNYLFGDEEHMTDHPNTLYSQDNGRYIVGKTCLRKAQLRFEISNLTLEEIYSSRYDIKIIVNNHKDVDILKKYTDLFHQRVEQLHNKYAYIMKAAASDKSELDELCIDNQAWACIDRVRRSVATNERETLEMLINRSSSRLNQTEEEEEEEEEEDASSSSDSFIDSEDDNCVTTSSSRPQPCVAKRRAAVLEDSEDDEEQEKEHESSILQTQRFRTSTTNPSSSAKKRRINRDLPNRMKVVSDLSVLQTSLLQQNKIKDATVCLNAVHTLLELLELRKFS